MSTSKRTSKTQSSLIYVGPTIKGLTKYSVFIGGYPQIHEQHKDHCPAFTTMFVNTTKLADVEKKISNPNSAESVFYRNVEKYFNGVK